VSPVEHQQLLRGYEAQPKKKWHCAILAIFVKPNRCFQEGFLNYIGRIDTALQSAIQPHLDHTAQSAAFDR
jgi:hypothetical protein